MARNVMRGGIASLLLTFCFAIAVQAQQRPASKAAVERIQRETRHRLVMLPNYEVFDSLAYKVEGYNVTLLGSVRNATLKSEAAAVVKQIEGVEKVDNQIEVLPASPNDDRIRVAEYRAIYGQSPLDRYALQAVPPIHIIVKNGNVTLVGTVANEADKNIAGMRARGVPGTFKVENQLQVEKNQ
jgi:osmotically-inducible protein OsmY